MSGATETAPDAIASVLGVTQRYNRSPALDSLSLELPAGRLVGLIGPDGVGKSTLLGLIAGARKLQIGRVTALGADMADARQRMAACARIAFMPQGLGRNLYPELSVFENLDFFGQLFDLPSLERHRRIRRLLEATGLAPFAERHAINLSGGMKQKLGLCCALIHDPDLLILDEPTTGVDPLSRRQFWRLIAEMRAARPGMSVLAATAYMEEAEAFDWLVLMDEGRVLATGTPGELMSRVGTADLEAAYVAYLPEAKRRGHRALAIPARTVHGDGPAIEARDLTRRFDDFTAVDGVSFAIERGEIFGFLGPNGCGKTTTMKMLTGLLPPTSGLCRLFGRAVEAGDVTVRKRIGYMSQSFSLYVELTVRQNLELHARLFGLPRDKSEERIGHLISRFGLAPYVDHTAEKLPLGLRQRLSLAVAVIHEPEILILDEPTSGVDPVARDQFWELLVELSRDHAVTVFVSTHFMHEAERCDRISLMDAGRVLAIDAPDRLVEARDAANLEQAFIAYLEEVRGRSETAVEGGNSLLESPDPAPAVRSRGEAGASGFRLARLWACARREALELSRDRIRLAFCFLAPLLLLFVCGYGISFDVEDLAYAVLDRDQSIESRRYLEQFEGSRYFLERRPIASYAELDRRLASGELVLAVEIPPHFGKDLKHGRRPQVAFWIGGGDPFRAETTRGYVYGAHRVYLEALARRTGGVGPGAANPEIEIRYRYNQDVSSIFAIVPGMIAVLLAFVPATLTAVAVVREKEMGAIVNLYVTPLTRVEFLLGKQLPYILVSLVAFVMLVSFAVFFFGVPLKGSFIALGLGALLYVTATTGFGLLMSAFTRTQVAALFATMILTIVPAIQYAGLLMPVSSLEGGGRIMGTLFPAAYFFRVSVGTFTKALEIGDLVMDYAALGAFVAAFLLLSLALLRRQEA